MPKQPQKGAQKLVSRETNNGENNPNQTADRRQSLNLSDPPRNREFGTKTVRRTAHCHLLGAQFREEMCAIAIIQNASAETEQPNAERAVDDAYPVALRGGLPSVRRHRRPPTPSPAVHLRRRPVISATKTTRCRVGGTERRADKFKASSRGPYRPQVKTPAPLKAPRGLRCSCAAGGTGAVQPPLLELDSAIARELCQRIGLGSVSYWVGGVGLGGVLWELGLRRWRCRPVAVAVSLDPLSTL